MYGLKSLLAAVFLLGALTASAAEPAPTALDKAFFMAVGHDDLAKARSLLAQGAHINAKERPWGLTPLLVAPDMSYAMLTFLLAHGADVNAADREGTTVLMRAVHSGDPKMVAAALRYHPRLEPRGPWNNTALTYAVVQGNPAMVKLLIDAGANVNAQRADGMRPLDMAKQRLAAMRALPPGMSHRHAQNGMPMEHNMMPDLPKSVLIGNSRQVLSLLVRAHALPGTHIAGSRKVLQHLNMKMSDAM